MKLSPNKIKGMKPKNHAYDSKREPDGFLVRVYPSGRKVFQYVVRVNGKEKRTTIGEFPLVTLEQARLKHQELRGKHARGESLSPQKTFKAVAEAFLDKHGSEYKDGGKEVLRILEKDVYQFIGHIKIDELKKAHIVPVLDEIIRRGANRQSNITCEKISRICRYACSCGWIDINPCDNIMKAVENSSRERVLQDDDIREFWHGIETKRAKPDMPIAMKLVLVTGQRTGECIGICEEEIDGRWWTIPKERTKNGVAHRIYLTDLALEVLGGRKSLCISSTQAVDKKLRDMFKPLKFDSAPRFKAEPYTPHDLRRTCSTNIGAIEENDLPIYDDDDIDRLLNHLQTKLRRTYNLYKYDNLKKRMLLDWEKKLLKIIKKAPNDGGGGSKGAKK